MSGLIDIIHGLSTWVLFIVGMKVCFLIMLKATNRIKTSSFIGYIAALSVGVFALSSLSGSGIMPAITVNCDAPNKYMIACNNWTSFNKETSYLFRKFAIWVIDYHGEFKLGWASLVVAFVAYAELSKSVHSDGMEVLKSFLIASTVFLTFIYSGVILEAFNAILKAAFVFFNEDMQTIVKTSAAKVEAYYNAIEKIEKQKFTKTAVELLTPGNNVVSQYLAAKRTVAVLYWVSMVNLIFLAFQVLIISAIPSLTLISYLIGAFDVYKPARYLFYSAFLSVIAALEIVVLSQIPVIDESTGFMDGWESVSNFAMFMVVFSLGQAAIVLKLIFMIFVKELFPIMTSRRC